MGLFEKTRSIDGYVQYMIDDLSILDDKKVSSPFPVFEQMKITPFNFT